MFFEFIWDGPAKIKYTVLVKQYTDGGLRMTNLKAFILSLKATWLRRVIKKENTWQHIMKDKINFKEVFDFGKNYTDLVVKQIKNQFWIDVLIAYSNILDLNNEKTQEFILSSSLFYNHKINIGGKPTFLKTWYDNGVTYVNDMVNENGEFYTQQEFENKYNIKSNFNQFQGIKEAIKVFARKK